MGFGFQASLIVRLGMKQSPVESLLSQVSLFVFFNHVFITFYHQDMNEAVTTPVESLFSQVSSLSANCLVVPLIKSFHSL